MTHGADGHPMHVVFPLAAAVLIACCRTKRAQQSLRTYFLAMSQVMGPAQLARFM